MAHRTLSDTVFWYVVKEPLPLPSCKYFRSTPSLNTKTKAKLEIQTSDEASQLFCRRKHENATASILDVPSILIGYYRKVPSVRPIKTRILVGEKLSHLVCILFDKRAARPSPKKRADDSQFGQ